MKYRKFTKGHNSVLDWSVDFAGLTNGSGLTNWLADGEIIVTSSVTAEAGLTVDSQSITHGGTKVTAWLSGGDVGEVYKVVFHAETNQGRVEETTVIIEVIRK